MTTGLADTIPILVGVGQCVDHWHGGNASQAPSPQSLMIKASRAAIADCGGDIGKAINVIAVTRLFADSGAGVRGAEAFGKCDNLPRFVGRAIGAKPQRAIYSVVGGQTPQALINEFAEEIFAGRAQAVLLTGSEAIAAAKTALRGGLQLNWADHADGEMEDRGFGSWLVDKYELANGIGAPTMTYPVFENALRARLGKSEDQYADDMAALWHRFSKIAAGNRYAQFPVERSEAFLRAASDANYPISSPYLKWHVAQDAVNQGAALILTSVRKARELGIARDKWVFLHGYGEASEKLVSERADISRALAAEKSLQLALHTANKTAAGIQHFDLYSCFPVAVFLAAEALGLDWRTIELTLTGGLPFFGGAGNNYAMHAIAAMAEKLRKNPQDYGLVIANGGFLSKQAVGIYSMHPTPDWQPVSSTAIQAEIRDSPATERIAHDCEAAIESYSVVYRKGTPERALIFAKDGDGKRVIATAGRDSNAIPELQKSDPIGRRVTITTSDNTNIVSAIS